MKRGLLLLFISSVVFILLFSNNIEGIPVLGQNSQFFEEKHREDHITYAKKEEFITSTIKPTPQPDLKSDNKGEINDKVVENTLTHKSTATPKIEQKKTNVIEDNKKVDSKKPNLQTKDNQKSESVVLLGDSITEGLSIFGFFPEYKIIGINSLNTISAKEHVADVTQLKPTKLFVLLGINDIWGGDPVDEYIVRYTNLLKDIKEKNKESTIYIESIFPVSQYAMERNPSINNKIIDDANQKLMAVAKELNVNYIDINSKLKDEKGNLKSQYSNDGVHLINTYYPIWTDTLTSYINK